MSDKNLENIVSLGSKKKKVTVKLYLLVWLYSLSYYQKSYFLMALSVRIGKYTFNTNIFFTISYIKSVQLSNVF